MSTSRRILCNLAAILGFMLFAIGLWQFSHALAMTVVGSLVFAGTSAWRRQC